MAPFILPLVTLHANDGYTFSKDEGAMTAYINNKPADIVNISEDGQSMTISHQFYKTSVMGGGNSGHSTGTTPTATPKTLTLILTTTLHI